MTFGAGWYAVAVAEGLEPGTSAGTRLFDREIVIWRDSDGISHAWEDRCPHRGMRMSFGFVRGNHIACLYHGWQYDTAGQCRYIPAHPDLEVPDTIKVAVYPSAEAGGLLWIWSEPAADAPVPPPHGNEGTAIRSLYLDRPAEIVATALAGEGFDAQSPASFEGTVEGTLIRLELQPFTADRAALHIVRRAGDLGPQAIADWSETLRRRIERLPADAEPALVAAEA